MKCPTTRQLRAAQLRLEELDMESWNIVSELHPALVLLAAAHRRAEKDEDGETPFGIAIHLLHLQALRMNDNYDEYLELSELVVQG